jgi:hypothetical protein
MTPYPYLVFYEATQTEVIVHAVRPFLSGLNRQTLWASHQTMLR